jgi:ABC-type uncharacterized transport system permease subunit
MSLGLVYSLFATLFLVPPLATWALPKHRWLFWLNLFIATLFAGAAALRLAGPHWSAALGVDLWVTVTATLVLFTLVCFRNRQARSLSLLVMPYLLLLGVMACFTASLANVAVSEDAPTGWISVHILVSVILLGLLTLSAAAALASFIQSRALKTKHPNALSRLLPPVSDSERLYEGLLIVSEVVLAVGVATGMATEFAETGRLLIFDHKTLFSLLAFVLIGGLVAGRRWGGVRGQMAVRLLLVAYSFVLLGYFGVKFVKQVLLS